MVPHLTLLITLAVSEPAAQPLTFAQTLALADAHPRLGAFAAGLERRTRLDRDVSSLTQNPTIGVFPGWRRYDEGEGFEGIVSIAQGFNVAGPGRRGRTASEAHTRLAEARAALVAFEIRTRAAVAWLELSAAQAKAQSLREEERVADELVQTIDRGVAAGHFLAVELADAQIYRAEIELFRRMAEGDRVDLAYRLAQTLALDPATTIEAAGPPPTGMLPASVRAEPWLARAEALPAARLAALASATHSADRAFVEASAGTNLQTSLSLQREATGDVIGLMGLSVTFPLFERAERARSEAEYREVLGTSDAATALIEARRAIVMAVHEVEHTREISEHVDATLLPAAERYATLVELQLERARVAIVDVLRARRRVTEERRRKIEADRARLVAEARAVLLFGTIEFQEGRS